MRLLTLDTSPSFVNDCLLSSSSGEHLTTGDDGKMHLSRSFFSAILILGIGMSACDGREPEPGPSATGASVETAGECPNEPAALQGAPEGSLTGDVTGDGEPDSIVLHADEDGAPGCTAFLSIDGRWSAAIDQDGMVAEAGLPSLMGLVQIDGRPGLDIVVRLLSGASTEFAGVFTVGSGQLERLQIDDAAGSGDLFAYGGGVTHLDGVDCDEEGRVVIASAVSQDAEVYQVTRTIMELGGSALVPIEMTESEVPAEEVHSLPELTGAPFGSCPLS